MISVDHLLDLVFHAHASVDPVGTLAKAKRMLEQHIRLAEGRGADDRLRDNFAGLALQGLVARGDYVSTAHAAHVARDAYQLADAMLKEREMSRAVNEAVAEAKGN